MKTTFLKLTLLLFAIPLLFGACKENDDDIKPDDKPAELNNYTASGSYGDVIRYQIDETNHLFKYYNETTGESDSGAYTKTNNANISGVYEIGFSGNTYHVIELADKVIATSAPSGRLENKLCFGITADLNLSATYSMSDLAGRYLFITYDDFSSDENWGGYELLANGTFTWNIGPDDEADFDVNTHFSGGGTGTWAISPTDPSRVIFTEAGIDYTGTIYPGKAMLLDNGVGQGYTIGINYPSTHVTQSAVAGSYRALDITTDGETGVGTYTMPASGGNLSYYVNYSGVTGIDSGTATNFSPVPQINNMFKASADYDGETFTTWFVLLPGEVMLHFSAGESTGLVGYGVGAKLD